MSDAGHAPRLVRALKTRRMRTGRWIAAVGVVGERRCRRNRRTGKRWAGRYDRKKSARGAGADWEAHENMVVESLVD